MNDEKQKYANGDSLDISKMSKEEVLRAIEYWSEGNAELKKLLLYFNEKNIQTIGGCSGHNIDREHSEAQGAYIAIKLGEKEDNNVLDLLSLIEEDKQDMRIGFIRAVDNKMFCTLHSNIDRYNEEFFKKINEQCQKLDNQEHINKIYRRKYEMLRTLLIDDRAKREDRSTQYFFDIGDESVQAVGFFKFSNRRISIPNDEIERLGRTFINNPGKDLPKDFYSSEEKEVKQSVNTLKEIANKSKLPLSSIRQAFENIRNTVVQSNNMNKELEEGGR